MLKGIKRGKGSKGALYHLHSLLSTIPYLLFFTIYSSLYILCYILVYSLCKEINSSLMTSGIEMPRFLMERSHERSSSCLRV